MIQKCSLFAVCFWLSIYMQEIILSVFGFSPNIKIFYGFCEQVDT